MTKGLEWTQDEKAINIDWATDGQYLYVRLDRTADRYTSNGPAKSTMLGQFHNTFDLDGEMTKVSCNIMIPKTKKVIANELAEERKANAEKAQMIAEMQARIDAQQAEMAKFKKS